MTVKGQFSATLIIAGCYICQTLKILIDNFLNNAWFYSFLWYQVPTNLKKKPSIVFSQFFEVSLFFILVNRCPTCCWQSPQRLKGPALGRRSDTRESYQGERSCWSVSSTSTSPVSRPTWGPLHGATSPSLTPTRPFTAIRRPGWRNVSTIYRSVQGSNLEEFY